MLQLYVTLNNQTIYVGYYTGYCKYKRYVPFTTIKTNCPNLSETTTYTNLSQIHHQHFIKVIVSVLHPSQDNASMAVVIT